MAEMDAPRVVDEMLIIEKQKSKNIFQEIWGLAEISEIILKCPQVPNLSPTGGNPRFLREYKPHVKASLSFLLLPSHLHSNSNCFHLQHAQHIIVTGRVGHFSSTLCKGH